MVLMIDIFLGLLGQDPYCSEPPSFSGLLGCNANDIF